MSKITVSQAADADRTAIFALEQAAFGRRDEAELVERIVWDGDRVLELVAERDGAILGHVLFSRLHVETERARFAAVALAPIAVYPDFQGGGIGSALIEEGHRLLREAGETLSVVLGESGYYGRFGYTHERARGFDSDYQCEALQAVAWDDEAPPTGRLVYPRAFAGT